MDAFTFDPADGFNNTASYPDPASGTAAREQLMSLHTQVQTFINNQLVPAVNNLQQTVSTISGNQTTDEGNITTLQGDVRDLNTAVEGLTTAINGFSTNFTTSGLKIIYNSVTYSVSVDENGFLKGTAVV